MARYIDADATLSIIKKYLYETALNNFTTDRKVSDICENIAIHRIAEWIDEVPSADVVEVKHGEWTEEGYCPFCKCDMPAFIEDWEWKRCRTPYCPNCGADMRGDGKEVK